MNIIHLHPFSKTPIYKIITASLLFIILILSTPSFASERLVSSDIIEKIKSAGTEKKLFAIDGYTIVLNHTIDEFKDALLEQAKSKKNTSDSLYKFIGLNTEGYSDYKFLKNYFKNIDFTVVRYSPAFAMQKIKAIYIDVKRVLADTELNINKHYHDLQNKTYTVMTTINQSPPVKSEVDRFEEYLDSLSSEELLSTSTESLISDFNKTSPPVRPPLNPDKLQKSLLVIKNKMAKINNVFQDWSWFLQPKLYQPQLSLKEISDNNMNIDWIYLHELGHLLTQQQQVIDFSFRTKSERSLVREMKSDLFAALMLDYPTKSDFYKKIDSIIFSRTLKNSKSKHFTTAPLMALKILMSHPDYSLNFTYNKKIQLLDALMDSTSPHLKNIIKIGDSTNSKNHEDVAERLKGVVRDILMDISNDNKFVNLIT